MPTHSLRAAGRILVTTLLAVTAAGCKDDPVTVPPPGGPLTIASGVWYLQTANASELPVRISDRFIGVVFEEIFLDSAQLTINGATRTYQQRWWTRVQHSGVDDRVEFVADEGSFTEDALTYVFTSEVRARVFTITVPDDELLTSNEAMAFHAGAPTVAGGYRRTPP